VKIKISADSTCDLSKELLEKYEVGILPLYVVRDGEDLRDGIDINQDELFDHHKKTGRLCSTSAISVADYHEYFSELLKEHDEIVHFIISSDMSACYQNACIAAQDLKDKGNVYPVDSRNLSTGIGLLVINGAKLAAEGLSGAEILERVDAMKEKLDVSFLVDTLEYLHKGGRCSTIAALGANILSLKPCIEVKNGKMGVGKKYRGGLHKCLLQYTKDRLDGATDIDTSCIFVTYSGGEGFSDDIWRDISREVLKYQPFENVYVTRTGCTVSSHCGPGTLGLLLLRK